MSDLTNKMVNGDMLNDFARKIKANIKSDLLGNKRLRYVTQEEYDALTNEQKNDENIVWNITDPVIEDYVTEEELDQALEELIRNEMSINYDSALAFDTNEIAFGNGEVSTSSILGKAKLNRLVLK